MVSRQMCSRAVASAVCLAAVTACLTAMADAPVDFKGQWNEVGGDGGPWYGTRKAAVVGALGFDVVLDGWPRLLQRGFYDIIDAANGTREVYTVSGWLDLGLFRTGNGQPADPRLLTQSWCHREYALAGPADEGKLYVSRLTPAVLLAANSPELGLFAGTKRSLRGFVEEGLPKANMADIMRGALASWLKRNKPVGHTVPRHVAYVSGGKVVVADTSRPQALDKLDEPWLLFWYGEDTTFYRTRVPNVMWRTSGLLAAMREGYFIPADLPVLVILQNKPTDLRPAAECLRLAFGQDGAGATSIVPLLGFHHPPAEQTQAWKDGLPEDIVARCRAWASRLKSYPLRCSQTWEADGDWNVAFRDTFTYLDLPDAWASQGRRFAPLPPVAAIAKRYGFSLSTTGQLADMAIPTHSGPYTGILDADSTEYVVEGLGKYLNAPAVKPVSRAALGTWAGAEPLREELQAEVRKLIEAGPLAPATSPRAGFHPAEFDFANPGETILAIAEAYPYMDRGLQPAAIRFVLDTARQHDPLTTRTVPYFQGSRREYYELLPIEYSSKIDSGEARLPREASLSIEQRINNVYALWRFAEATGKWNLLRSRWDQIKDLLADDQEGTDWASCGYFRTRDESRGSVEAANARFGRSVALARTAEKLGDEATCELARASLARTALLRFAQGKAVRYMYDEKFQTIHDEPDWMLKLSVSPGESGPSLPWEDHWAGADDDTRTVLAWDEFGPVVGWMYGNHWDPILPHFLGLGPEAGQFIHDLLLPESARFLQAIQANAPAWHVTRRASYLGKENSMDSPRNAGSLFLGMAYALQADGATLLQRQDIPFVKVGDLFHIRRLAANLWAMDGAQPRKVTKKQEDHVSVAASLPSTTSAADWPQAGANPTRTSHVDSGPDGPYELAWTKQWPGEVPRNSNQPIIVGGVVYVATENGVVHAVRLEDGKDLWRTDVGSPIIHALAGDAGRVYAARFDGNVTALDRATGQLAWSTDLSRRGFSCAALLMDGRIFLGNRDGVFYALSANDGQLVWKYDTGDPIVQTAAGLPRADAGGVEGKIVVVNDALKAFCLAAEAGRLIWLVQLPGRSVRDYWPVIHQGKVILRTEEAVTRSKTLRLTEVQQRLYWPTKNPQQVHFHAKTSADIVREQDIFVKFFQEFPRIRTFFVLDLSDGTEPYMAGVLSGCRNSGVIPPPVVAGDGGLYTTFLTGAGDNGVVTITRACLGRVDLTTGKIDRPLAGWGAGNVVAATGVRSPFELTSDETVTLASGGNVLFGIRTDASVGAIHVDTGRTDPLPRVSLPRTDDLLPTGNLFAISGKYVLYVKARTLICNVGR